MIRTEVERIPIKVWSKRENAPHDGETFLFGRSVVLLRVREGTAPIIDR